MVGDDCELQFSQFLEREGVENTWKNEVDIDSLQ